MLDEAFSYNLKKVKNPFHTGTIFLFVKHEELREFNADFKIENITW